MRKATRKTPFIFYVGMTLLCLVLFSTYLTSGLYARYTTAATSEDNARVAKFDVTNSITDSQKADIKLNFYNSDMLTDDFKFTVKSNSEVSVKYNVIVTLPEGTYDWLSITLDGVETTYIEDNVFTFYDVYSFDPTASEDKVHTLTFAIKKSYHGNATNIDDIKGDIKVTVHAEQEN